MLPFPHNVVVFQIMQQCFIMGHAPLQPGQKLSVRSQQLEIFQKIQSTPPISSTRKLVVWPNMDV